MLRGLCLLLLATASRPVWAIDVYDVRWGFDGTVVEDRFNLLTLELGNDGTEPFDGVLELYSTLGGLDRVGEIQAAPVYLTPGTARIVQFAPYVSSAYSDWRLRIGRRLLDIPRPSLRQQDRTVVAIVPTTTSSSPIEGVRTFPAERFPSSATRTGGLTDIVLDEHPRWQPAQRQAFLDWFHAGGTVHVVQRNGRFPTFSGEFALLNRSDESYHVGTGTVERYSEDPQTLDREDLRTVTMLKQEDAAAANEHYVLSGLDSAVFARLRNLTRAEHNWTLIYILSFAYLLLIGPGGLVLGRKRGSYRVVYAALLAVAGLFSASFLEIGARGYGERAQADTVAMIRPAAGDRALVEAWMNVFVTGGGDYSIAHQGDGVLYSAAEESERTNGIVTSGPQARFLVDIPPFSSRAVVTAFVAPISVPVPEIVSVAGKEEIRAMKVAIPSGSLPPIKAAYAVYKDRVHRVSHADDAFELRMYTTTIADTLTDERLQSNIYGWNWRAESRDSTFSELIYPAMARSLQISSKMTQHNVSLPEDRVRFLIYTDLPESLRVPELADRQYGRALYVLDVFL